MINRKYGVQKGINAENPPIKTLVFNTYFRNFK